jgi:hypothetical protein
MSLALRGYMKLCSCGTSTAVNVTIRGRYTRDGRLRERARNGMLREGNDPIRQTTIFNDN